MFFVHIVWFYLPGNSELGIIIFRYILFVRKLKLRQLNDCSVDVSLEGETMEISSWSQLSGPVHFELYCRHTSSSYSPSSPLASLQASFEISDFGSQILVGNRKEVVWYIRALRWIPVPIEPTHLFCLWASHSTHERLNLVFKGPSTSVIPCSLMIWGIGSKCLLWPLSPTWFQINLLTHHLAPSNEGSPTCQLFTASPFLLC